MASKRRYDDYDSPETLEEMWLRKEEEATGAATPWKPGEPRAHLLAPRAPPGPSTRPPKKKRGGSRHKKSKRKSKKRKSKRRSKKKKKSKRRS